MSFRVRSVLVAALLSLLAVSSATAATVQYFDQSDFLNNVQPGYYLETFDSQTTGTQIAGPISFSGNGYSYDASAIGGFFNISNGSDVYLSTYDPNSAITLDFTGNPVTALGGYVFGTDYSGNPITSSFDIFLSDGTNVVLTTDSSSFTGFTSTVPITSVTFNPITNGAFATLNNFYVGAKVPEPASIGILGCAAAFTLLRRRSV